MNNYWVLEEEKDETTESILVFMNEQCKILENMTNGSVFAMFIPQRACMFETVDELAKNLIKANPRKRDAGELYNKSWYEFFITDCKKEYELAIFLIDMKYNFPTIMHIDEEIAMEAKIDPFMNVESMDEYEILFKSVVQTKKVKHIINKLMRIKETKKEPQQTRRYRK